MTNADIQSDTTGQEDRWTLDGIGNWQTRQTDDFESLSFFANEMNEYVEIGVTAQTHDANGNLLQDGTRQFVYDPLNRLVRVETDAGATLARYAYDGAGRRTQVSSNSEGITRYLYDGSHCIEERGDDGATLRQYVYGPRTDEILQMRVTGDQDYFHHANALGSISSLTDASGSVAERYLYDAYGATTTLAANGTTELA